MKDFILWGAKRRCGERNCSRTVLRTKNLENSETYLIREYLIRFLSALP
jgi:hypothetical protein